MVEELVDDILGTSFRNGQGDIRLVCITFNEKVMLCLLGRAIIGETLETHKEISFDTKTYIDGL